MTDRTIKNDVIIPAGQAIVIGTFLGLSGASLAAIRDGNILMWGLLSSSISATVTYILKTSLPGVSSMEIKPPTRVFADEVNINVSDFKSPYPNGIKEKIRHKRKLPDMARVIKLGGSFSYADLAGKGKTFSRGHYEQVRSDMLICGFIYWLDKNSHTTGMGFTRGGMAFIDHQYKKILTPPPRRTRVRERLAPAL